MQFIILAFNSRDNILKCVSIHTKFNLKYFKNRTRKLEHCNRVRAKNVFFTYIHLGLFHSHPLNFILINCKIVVCILSQFFYKTLLNFSISWVCSLFPKYWGKKRAIRQGQRHLIFYFFLRPLMGNPFIFPVIGMKRSGPSPSYLTSML